jgi:hypothetical protein
MMYPAGTQSAPQAFVRRGVRLKRRRNFGINTLLSGVGTLVIFVLFTAGICDALRRRIFV